MRRAAPALVLLAAALAAACGDIPQPFRHDGPNVPVAPLAGRGVVVRPLDEEGRSQRLANAMVRRLLEMEIPAATREVVSGATVIAAEEVEPGPSATRFVWRLRSPGTEPLAEIEQKVPNGAWDRATPKTMELMAAEVIDAFAKPLTGQMDEPIEADAGRPAPPTVRLVTPAGLPGDGDRSLAAAMRRLLGASGVRLVDGEADFVVKGQATVTAGKPGEDMLAVAWTVTGKAGETLGTANQQGPVPKGRLAGPWGALAGDIAGGGVEGVAQIIGSLGRRQDR